MSKVWTEDKLNQLKIALKLGASNCDIAKEMKKTPKQIEKAIYNYGLKSYRKDVEKKIIIPDNEVVFEKKGKRRPLSKKEIDELCRLIGAKIYKNFETVKLEEPICIKNKKKKPEEISILDISDVHQGMINEIYDEAEGKKIVTYNSSIFKKQLYNLKKSIFEIHKIQSHEFNLKKLVIFVLGDIVTNDRIFPEQSFEIEKCVGLQIWDAVTDWSKFFNDLLAIYETVEVVCVVGNHGRCFDKNTRILTKKGWKNYKEITSKEVVATYNMEMNIIEWQQITDKHVYFNEPSLVQLKNNAIDITTTPDHEIVVKTSKGNTIKKYASTLEKEKSIVIPATAKSDLSEYCQIKDDELRLLGWILTDGSYIKKQGYLQIYQSKENNINLIRNLLNKLNINFTEDVRIRETKIINNKKVLKTKPSHTFRILSDSSKILNKKFQFKNKKELPDWCFKLSDRQVNVFLESLLLGDGTVRENDKVLYGKKEFLEKIQALLITHNILASLNKNNRGDYYLQIREGKQYSIQNGGKSIKYNDTVWCVTVPNGTVVVEKNGNPFICGNSNPTHYNEPVENNFEYFIYRTWQKEFEKSKRIKIIVPDTGRYIHQVGNWRHLIEHGHYLRGYSENAIKNQLKELFVNMGKFDVMHFGHLHQLAEKRISDKVLVKQNGCWVLRDEYAFKKFQTYSIPEQHFFGCNNKRKETWKYAIDLRG